MENTTTPKALKTSPIKPSRWMVVSAVQDLARLGVRRVSDSSYLSEYEVYEGDVLLGRVYSMRVRTPQMSGRIAVGYSERTAWKARDASGHSLGSHFDSRANAALRLLLNADKARAAATSSTPTV